ncbi:MAG: tRNA pseudouridine(38-40) synthase TruA [Phycisphaerae bacterium]|nr:tRNA pseudouridine(38-40) synthase TruA [Phycisphaerae bacterium]
MQPGTSSVTEAIVYRHRVVVAYEGTEFHGWQRQVRANGTEFRTVQRSLEDAVFRVFHERVPVVGASRTDSGVHAIGQVAAFNTKKMFKIDRVAIALTSQLPPDVQVRDSRVVARDFDPIAHARSKCYRYDIAIGRPPESWQPLFSRRTTYRAPYSVDAEAMNEAAKKLIGTHDVAGLAQKHHGRGHTVRTIFDCRVARPAPNLVRIEVVGNGFLYNMVRIIAGTLLEIGRDRMPPERIDEVLATRNRRRAGQTLPPHGLSLRWIHYGPGDLPATFPEGTPNPVPGDEP